jgi:hypothetical protein
MSNPYLDEFDDRDPLYDPSVWLMNAKAILERHSGSLDKFEKGLCGDLRPKNFHPSDNQVVALKKLIARLNLKVIE